MWSQTCTAVFTLVQVGICYKSESQLAAKLQVLHKANLSIGVFFLLLRSSMWHDYRITSVLSTAKPIENETLSFVLWLTGIDQPLKSEQ